tara:strand:+ start:82838 stop:83239 length:402 start_codon:yes stop_codon:yes gene_type:complete
MIEFSNDIEINIKSRLNKTENVETVLNAIENIMKIECEISDSDIIGSTKDYNKLKNLYNAFRNKQTTHIARKVLFRNSKNNSSRILFNKQAAVVNSIVICEKTNESPLGPILMEIKTEDIEEFIDWFVPKHNF